MAARLDMLPKQYGEVVCDICSQTLAKAGPNNKRCAACKPTWKRRYEREARRALVARAVSCSDCGVPFPPNTHAATIRCELCAKLAHQKQSNASNCRRHHRVWRNDPGHRLHRSMSALARRALGKSKAGWSWEKLVGYDLVTLRAHLERQFTKGMTWQNFGQWHVDHILPRASFQFASAEDPEFKACWSLTNLRPLWADDNLRKRDQRLHLI